MRFGLMFMYPDATVGATGGAPQTPTFQAKNADPSQKQEEVITQKVSIFSSYDTSQDGKVNNSDTKHQSIFQLNTSALNSLKPANVAENAQNLSTIRKVANAQIGGVSNKFSEMVNKFSFNVGKQSVDQKVGEDYKAANDAQTQNIMSQMNAKVEAEIDKMNTQYNQMISDMYMKALDEVANQVGVDGKPEIPEGAENDKNFVDEISQPEGIGTGRNEDGSIKHLDGTKVDADGNTVTDANTKIEKTTQEVFSAYDGNKDKHVKFNELDSSLFTKFTGTVNSHVNTSTAGGQEIDKFANYNVDAKFSEYIKAFDANVGSKTLSAKGDKIDQNDIATAKSDLNRKAEAKATEFATKVNNQVAKERTAALEKAYQQYLKDPNGVKEANQQREAARAQAEQGVQAQAGQDAKEPGTSNESSNSSVYKKGQEYTFDGKTYKCVSEQTGDDGALFRGPDGRGYEIGSDGKIGVMKDSDGNELQGEILDDTEVTPQTNGTVDITSKTFAKPANGPRTLSADASGYDKLAASILDSLDNLLSSTTGKSDSDIESAANTNEDKGFNKGVFNQCRKGGLTPRLANFVASTPDAKPILKDGKVVSVEFTGADGKKVTVKTDDLEKYIKDQTEKK